MLFDDSPLLSLFEQFDKIYTILVLSLSIFDSLLSITFFDAFHINADLSCFTLFHVAKYCFIFYYIVHDTLYIMLCILL